MVLLFGNKQHPIIAFFTVQTFFYDHVSKYKNIYRTTFDFPSLLQGIIKNEENETMAASLISL